MSSNNSFHTLVESHEVVGSSEENYGVGVIGLALPFDKVSRNGFRYIKESIIEGMNSVIGAPALFNHDSEKVIGHIENASVDGEGMTYKMNLDEGGPYGWVANKVRRGDLKKVSIQCIYDEDKSYLDDDGVMNAWVKEFLEISVVTIPGFADTTAQVVEKFKSNSEGNTTMSKEEEQQKDEVVDTSTPQEETPSADETPQEEVSNAEAVDDNEDEEKDDKKASEEEGDRLADLERKVASLQAMVDDMKKESEPEDDEEDSEESCDDKAEEEEEPEEDKEKKVEEAIRNDKQSISTEQVSEESISRLSSADLKELYAKFV